jgi:hypothetical protein
VPPTLVTVRRDYVAQILLSSVILAAGAFALPSSQSPVPLAGLVLLAAGGLLLEVELPEGGTISMGHPVVIAYAGRMSVQDFIVVVGLALLIVTLPELRRHGRLGGGLVMLVLTGAAGCALLGRLAGNALVRIAPTDHRISVVAPVLFAGFAYLGIVSLLQLRLSAVGGRRKGWRSAFSIYVSLLCAAALLALASQKATALGAVALLPLLVLRFSFRRYFDARRTYLQTTQALSMIPEVAGLTPLGHGERTAVYAAALAEWLDLSPERVDMVATVARVHHIGQIAHPDLPIRPYGPEAEERQLIAQASADILGETFLKEMAGVVAAVQAADSAALGEVEAIVRVASTLDDLVGEGPASLSEAVLSVLARHEHGIERTMAIQMAELCDSRPSLAQQAQQASAGVASSDMTLGLVGTGR